MLLSSSRGGGGRRRALGGGRPLGSCSLSRPGRLLRARDGGRPGRLLRLVFKAQEQEGNGVGGVGMVSWKCVGSTGDLMKTGDGNIVTGCPHPGILLSSSKAGCTMPSTWGLMELPCSQVIPTGESSAIGNVMAHPGTKLLSSSNTSTACQTTVSSRAPPTQPHQLDIGRSCPITTAVPMPAC